METKFIVVSDSHGLIEPLNNIYNKYCNDIKLFFHCGDAEVNTKYLINYKCVNGNNGYDPNLDNEIIYKFNNNTILLIHGHKQLIYGLDNLAYYAKEKGCNIVLFGHTHIFTHTTINGVTLINPGSLNYNRDNTDPSYCIVDTNNNTITVNKLYL